eukprot:7239368-Prymnesium_polylepis.1
MAMFMFTVAMVGGGFSSGFNSAACWRNSIICSSSAAPASPRIAALVRQSGETPVSAVRARSRHAKETPLSAIMVGTSATRKQLIMPSSSPSSFDSD